MELRLVPEKRSFADRNLVEQLAKVRFASWTGRKNREVFAKGIDLHRFHAAPTTVAQEIELVVGLKYPTHLVNEIADQDEAGIAAFAVTVSRRIDKCGTARHWMS